MARRSKGRRRIASRNCMSHPYALTSCKMGDLDKEMNSKKSSKVLDRKDWEDATCSVCMEFPHNAVLLLCSSYDKGCRPYMCGTSFRYSNCLNQFKKAYTKVLSPHQSEGLEQDALGGSVENVSKPEVTELACPLCRGQVKGCTVVEAAREYLNAKKRSCMQENCSFVGTYKELRKHVRVEHPSARPHHVDPILEQKWRNLVWERERDDVLSTIMSSNPGATVLGDYVIEGGLSHNHIPNHLGFIDDEDDDFDDDDDDDDVDDLDSETGIGDPEFYGVFSLLGAFVSGGNAGFQSRLRRLQRGLRARNGGGGHGPSMITSGVAAATEVENEPPIRGGRILALGRSRRRHRRRNQHEW